MNKKKILIFVGVGLAISLFIWNGVMKTNASGTVTVKTVNPEMIEVVNEVMIPGKVELLKKETILNNPELGGEYQLLVEDGDKVEQGTPLVRYSNRNIKMDQELLELQIESGYLRINHIERQEKQLAEEKERAYNEMGKEETEKQFQAETDQLRLDKRMANLDLRQLLIQRDELNKLEENLTVHSDAKGKVMIPDSNSQSDKLLEIVADEFVVTGFLSEYDSILLAEGQDVRIASDMFPGEEWQGSVHQIGYFPIEDSLLGGETAMVQYPITVKINKGKTELLKPGYQMIMNVVLEEKEALTIPSEAIEQTNEEAFVYVMEEGRTVKRNIEIGITERNVFEVTKGLSTDDQVILHDSVITEGMAVESHD
ncbi:efflux RND transporter periplasmic adaptor subunit [Halalkalibacter krulwichiae]|uniref:Putative efflux system component YknX n=1 Tax=Halalkalibacter krulwichiae TaxID=199441 RepID=A0A1X9MG38_9BACI|nr:efflux RND transporter periplasmic adaptor subunit [Halalkalibacter krulwichiae]ARK32386.1 Putative efflux system component YknX [Halalkalibacter krulwichiae]